MKCCTPHATSASKIFSFFARSYRRRFSKKGFEPSQTHLLEGILKAGLKNQSILEIGCGVGHLHQTLLEKGATKSIGIDLAPTMISEAIDWAAQRKLTERTQYYTGDFLLLADDLPDSDLTVLDKVVCCDPNARQLIHASLEKTGASYALTYPRKRWMVQFGIGVGALFLKLIGSDFRPYLHDPQQIENWIVANGFKKIYQNTTMVWLTQVYKKQA